MRVFGSDEYLINCCQQIIQRIVVFDRKCLQPSVSLDEMSAHISDYQKHQQRLLSTKYPVGGKESVPRDQDAVFQGLDFAALVVDLDYLIESSAQTGWLIFPRRSGGHSSVPGSRKTYSDLPSARLIFVDDFLQADIGSRLAFEYLRNILLGNLYGLFHVHLVTPMWCYKIRL